jgi:hypothetical protein
MTARADARATLLARLRRASRLPVSLAVFVFALRALVPTGFMLMPVDGQMQWVLCPDAGAAATAPVASGPVPASAGASIHAHHHHGGLQAGMPGNAMAAHSAGHESQPHCPFALASAAPLAGSLPALVAPWSELRLSLPAALQPGRAADAPLRHAAARGPPTLA